MTRFYLFIVFIVLPAMRGSAADDLQLRLAAAKPGQTVELPEGEFRGGVTLPPGVCLKGAGYSKTIINAVGAERGIVIQGGGSIVGDLTVRGATGENVVVQGGENVILHRLRTTGGLIGVSVANGRQCRVENVVSDGNRYGLIVAGGEGNVVVNCTLADNASLGLSLSSGVRVVAFNNCVTGSSTAVYVGEEAKDVVLDHNLYLGLNIGKFGTQMARDTLNNWKYLSSQDAHSVSIPVTYEDVSKGQFAVVNVLEWALDRPVTAGWGAASLGGKVAPDTDIDGKPRNGTPDLGAQESVASAPRPAEGTLTVTSGMGLSSAGVFDSKGKLISYLFQSLPLRAGKYSVWLPPRTYKGRKIEPGEYEVRLVESRLDWEYLGWIANTSESDDPAFSCAVNPRAVVFDRAGQLISGRGLSEAGDSLRALDGATGKSLWVFHGSASMNGLAIASDGLLYTLRRSHTDETRLTRIDPINGSIMPWGKSDFGQHVLKDVKSFDGFTALGEQLWCTDATNNVVHLATVQSPDPTKSISVKAPTSPAADAKLDVVWVISGGERVVAISADGNVLAEATPVPQPIALAARDGHLAVASKQTGKVHLFDTSDPTKLKPLTTIGSGDGPDGRLLPNRFLFQEGASDVCLALGPGQELAVGEDLARLQVFDRDGKLKWSSFSTGGWAMNPSKLTPGRVFAGGFTMMADSEQKKWLPESFHRALRGWVIGEFQVEGQTFIAMNDMQNGMSFVKFTPDKATPAVGIICPWASNEPWTYRADSNHDNLITPADAVIAPLTDAKGQPVTGRRIFDQKSNTIWPNGDLTSGSVEGWLTRWRCAGLDKQGNPSYQLKDRIPLANTNSDLVPPYDPKSQGGGSAEHEPRPNGGWMCLSSFAASPAVRHILLPGGTDLIGVDKDGVVDWVHTFGQYPNNPKIGSLDMADGIYIASLASTYDFFIVNSDGLSLQGFSFPERAHYVGHWVDHPDTVASFTDKSGRINVLTCDYMSNRNHWFVLRNKDIRESKTKLQVGPETASRLAALPVTKPDFMQGRPATPVVRIPQLKSPLVIDGTLQKWRDTGITPQIIITPESSSGIEGGPGDGSALVRLAYHGQDLYLQVLRFDDVIAVHQPRSRAYLQDALEMCVNGVMEGIKFNISQTTDNGAVDQVDGWALKAYTLDRKESPLVIKVLDTAEEVSERQLMENIFGVDLRANKVHLYETKIPMDAKTYAGRPDARFELNPGQKFWLGFMIDDNDQPGADVQHYLIWPSTYGTFSAKETGAIGVLE